MASEQVHAAGRGGRLRRVATIELGEDGVDREFRVGRGEVLDDAQEQLERRGSLSTFLACVGGHVVQPQPLDE